MPIHLPAPAHRNGGPDGQGWNRMSLGTLAGDECALRPRDYSHLVESQDTRRARYGGYGPCIACGRCLNACPLGLEPNQVSIRVEAARALDTEPFGALECYECGCCTYACPAHRPLVQFMQVAKAALRGRERMRVAS